MYKIGDKVRWCNEIGLVIRIDRYADKPIIVFFDKDGYEKAFTDDGRSETYYTVPSLLLDKEGDTYDTKTMFNEWVLKKITAYLENKEGFSTSKVEYTADGAETIIQDSFGFRYQVSIKTLSRLHDSPSWTNKEDGEAVSATNHLVSNFFNNDNNNK